MKFDITRAERRTMLTFFSDDFDEDVLSQALYAFATMYNRDNVDLTPSVNHTLARAKDARLPGTQIEITVGLQDNGHIYFTTYYVVD